MDRLSSKILVFTILLGGAGVAWGAFTAGTLGRGSGLSIIRAPEVSHTWTFAVTLGLVFLSTWLIGLILTKNAWKAALTTHGIYAFTFPYVISASILTILTDSFSGVIWYSIVGYFCISMLLPLVGMIKDRRERKIKGVVVEKKPGWQPISKLIAVLILVSAILFYAAVIISRGLSDPIERQLYLRGGNLSLIFSYLSGRVAVMNLPVMLQVQLISGAIFGMFAGTFAPETPDGQSMRRQFIGAGVGLLIGAIISVLTFATQAVQIVYAYDTAFDYGRILSGGMLLWGTCGVTTAILITGVLHGFVGSKVHRTRRLLNSLGFALVPVVVFLLASCSYIERKDIGRPMLAEADRIEGHMDLFGLGSKPLDYVYTYEANGGWILLLRKDRTVSFRQRHRHSHTTDYCDRFLADYPESAYKSAVLCTRYWCESLEWQPKQAISDWKVIQRMHANTERPKWVFEHLWLIGRSNYQLAGDFKEVIEVEQRREALQDRYFANLGEIRAAEVLGDWDEAIRMCRTALSRMSKAYEERWKSHYVRALTRAEAMKARNAGPAPRTDVLGSVLLDGKAQEGIVVCIIPSDLVESDTVIEKPSSAAARGGLLAVTDENGHYRIPKAPSGDYEVVIVLDANRFRAKYEAKATDLPFRVEGATCTAPMISLDSQLFTKQPAPKPGLDVL